MNKIRVYLLVFVGSVMSVSGGFAQDTSRYEQLVAAPAASSTVRSYAVALLALPYETESITNQLREVWWANNPELNIEESQRELAASEFGHQLDGARKAVIEHTIRRLELAGFTQVGTLGNLDLYYAADSDVGPIFVRVSVSFRQEAQPLLRGIKVFKGFDEARVAVMQIQYHAGERTVGVSYDPDSLPRSSADEDS